VHLERAICLYNKEMHVYAQGHDRSAGQLGTRQHGHGRRGELAEAVAATAVLVDAELTGRLPGTFHFPGEAMRCTTSPTFRRC